MLRLKTSYQKQSASISGEKNHFYGKLHSEEFKKMQSERMKKLMSGAGNSRAKTVRYKGTIYNTMKEMNYITNISLSDIRKMIENGTVEVLNG